MPAWLLLAPILCFAPLIKGGNRPLPLLFLELLSLLLLIGAIKRWQHVKPLGVPMLVLLALMLALPLLQLLPLPFSWWSSLSIQSGLIEPLQLVKAGDQLPRPLTLSPSLTEFSWLALLPPLLLFVYSFSLRTRTLRAIVPLFLAMAAFEAVLGLAQYGAGLSSMGTYANRDHLAGMLEMALPVSLALMVASLGQASIAHQNRRRGWRARLDIWLTTYFNRSAIYLMLSLGLMLGLIFTRSRTGVLLAMVLVLLCALAFSSRLGGRNVYGMLGTWVAVGLSLALLVGLVPVLDRFALEDPLKDARWTIYSSSLQAVQAFLPMGSGIGTFSGAFQRFHPDTLTGVTINHAHNDYLQWVIEGGVIAAIIILGLLLLYGKRWIVIMLQKGTPSTFKLVQMGAGIGLFLMLLHSLVDFNLRIPANQIYFAFLAALFFHVEQHEAADPAPAERHPKRQPVAASKPSIAPHALPIVPGKNPFEQ